MTGRKANLDAVKAATQARADVERKLAEAVATAKASGAPVSRIAEAAGFKTRRAVYLLLKRHGL